MAFKNLSIIQLYRVPVPLTYYDTFLFTSEQQRDDFFAPYLAEEYEDFTMLPQGREIRLPHNYAALRGCNLMKMISRSPDPEVPDEYWWALIDNFVYVSEKVCQIVYGIDPVLTYLPKLPNSIRANVNRMTLKGSDDSKIYPNDELPNPYPFITAENQDIVSSERLYVVTLNRSVNSAISLSSPLVDIGGGPGNRTYQMDGITWIGNYTDLGNLLNTECAEYFQSIYTVNRYRVPNNARGYLPVNGNSNQSRTITVNNPMAANRNNVLSKFPFNFIGVESESGEVAFSFEDFNNWGQAQFRVYYDLRFHGGNYIVPLNYKGISGEAWGYAVKHNDSVSTGVILNMQNSLQVIQAEFALANADYYANLMANNGLQQLAVNRSFESSMNGIDLNYLSQQDSFAGTERVLVSDLFQAQGDQRYFEFAIKNLGASAIGFIGGAINDVASFFGGGRAQKLDDITSASQAALTGAKREFQTMQMMEDLRLQQEAAARQHERNRVGRTEAYQQALYPLQSAAITIALNQTLAENAIQRAALRLSGNNIMGGNNGNNDLGMFSPRIKTYTVNPSFLYRVADYFNAFGVAVGNLINNFNIFRKTGQKFQFFNGIILSPPPFDIDPYMWAKIQEQLSSGVRFWYPDNPNWQQDWGDLQTNNYLP